MAEMHDLGETPSRAEVSPQYAGESRKPYYPSVSLKNVPGLEKVGMGKSVTLTFEAIMHGMHMGANGKKCYELELHGVTVG